MGASIHGPDIIASIFYSSMVEKIGDYHAASLGALEAGSVRYYKRVKGFIHTSFNIQNIQDIQNIQNIIWDTTEKIKCFTLRPET